MLWMLEYELLATLWISVNNGIEVVHYHLLNQCFVGSTGTGHAGYQSS